MSSKKSQKVIFSEKEYKFMLGCIEAEYTIVIENDEIDYRFENFVKEYIEQGDYTDEEKIKILDEKNKEVCEKIQEFEEYENTIEKLCRKLKCGSQTKHYGDDIQKMMEFNCDITNMKNKLKFKMAREKSWK
jgi:hypothetical protein